MENLGPLSQVRGHGSNASIQLLAESFRRATSPRRPLRCRAMDVDHPSDPLRHDHLGWVWRESCRTQRTQVNRRSCSGASTAGRDSYARRWAASLCVSILCRVRAANRRQRRRRAGLRVCKRGARQRRRGSGVPDGVLRRTDPSFVDRHAPFLWTRPTHCVVCRPYRYRHDADGGGSWATICGRTRLVLNTANRSPPKLML
jgi:hypothetical protein